ncbi:protein GET1 isoform X2 [Lactuca sativa]|uniref:protein GET1 isoform X2 n=1 Tax=Lactuca sativa TaxID=4236 RepID=UPI000CD8FC4A|nr:protein GET1 isoform X2 [Lactuca sativa]
MEETLEEHTKSLAAPIIFIIVFVFQLSDKFLSHMKTKASMSKKDAQLRDEIKQLLKEAAALSEPSTFAQSAKLRRMATAKEKELAKKSSSKEIKVSFSLYEKILMISKVVIYLTMIMWFWRIPVASISKELVQPFGRFLSWKTGGSFSNNVIMVGVIPWLILSTRVGKYLCNKVLK